MRLKIRSLFWVVAAVGALIVTVATVGASPFAQVNDPPGTGAQLATATPNGPTLWNIAGTIDSINGEVWMISGFAVHVTSVTTIEGSAPVVGAHAAAEGTVQSDGSWLATRIEVSPTATSTPSPTATVSPSPTATPTPSSTPTMAAPATSVVSASFRNTNDNDDADKFEISGIVQTIEGNRWTVSGVAFVVDSSTKQRGGPVNIGDRVEVEGVIEADGTLKATKIEVESDDERRVKPLAGDSQRIAGLAERFDVTADQVRALRESGLGWGEVYRILLLAERAEKPITDIVNLHDQIHGWGKIAKELGLEPGQHGDNLGRVMSGRTPMPTAAATATSSLKKAAKELREDVKNWGEVRREEAKAEAEKLRAEVKARAQQLKEEHKGNSGKNNGKGNK